MFGIVDCNNFYASCERAFDPSLEGRPVLVLSTNDGCVIARSNEVKALGIKMGAPFFEIRHLVKAHNIAVFSSNFELYGDMSARVMAVVMENMPEVEIYSIDEAFLKLDGFERYHDLRTVGMDLIRKVRRATGIPVSVGLANTKTLAKAANKYAKTKRLGCFLIDEGNREDVLKEFPVGDVWGIGRRYEKFLAFQNIYTAWDFVQRPRGWVRKAMSVVGERTWRELRGEPCIALDEEPAPKQNICTSRSFASMLTEYTDVETAVANHAASCARKLRSQGSCAGSVYVFVHSNYFRKDLPQCSLHSVTKLPVATSDSTEIVRAAKATLKRIFRPGYGYKKAGVIVSDIVPEGEVQGSLFDSKDRSRGNRLFETVDALNRKFGTNKVRLAAQGYTKVMSMRQESLSPCYSTRLADVITVKLQK